MSLAAIPEALRERDQWVGWRHERRKNRLRKVPVTTSGVRASTTDPNTWESFERVVAASRRFHGIGYVFAPDDPFCGIDLDHGFLDTEDVVADLDSYTERSVSGSGIHVIAKGVIGKGINRTPFEAYDRDRFFVMTGNHVAGTPTEIHERQEILDALVERFAPDRPKGRTASTATKPLALVRPSEDLRVVGAMRPNERELLFAIGANGRRSPSEADLLVMAAIARAVYRLNGRLDRDVIAGVFTASPRGDDAEQRKTDACLKYVTRGVETVVRTFDPNKLHAPSTKTYPTHCVSPSSSLVLCSVPEELGAEEIRSLWRADFRCSLRFAPDGSNLQRTAAGYEQMHHLSGGRSFRFARPDFGPSLCGVSDSAFYRATSELVRLGVIERVSPTQWRSNGGRRRALWWRWVG